MSPDNTQFLAYMAAKTERIQLLTGAVILPWHNPLRVVERMIVLDHLSKGRALFGIGRGLARREYDTFGFDRHVLGLCAGDCQARRQNVELRSEAVGGDGAPLR